MRNNLPVGELFPDDDLAPLSDESARYVYQIRKLNRVVIGLRELDASIGEKIRLAAATIDEGNTSLATTSKNLAENTVEREKGRVQLEELVAAFHTFGGTVEGMSRRVKDLEARLPDPKQVRLEILGDLWRAFDGDLLGRAEDVKAVLHAAVQEAANELAAAATQGFARPTKLADGANFRARLNFRRKQAAYHVRKFASDWLAVTLMIGVTVLVLRGVEFRAHGIF